MSEPEAGRAILRDKDAPRRPTDPIVDALAFAIRRAVERKAKEAAEQRRSAQ